MNLGEESALWQLFHDTVRTVNLGDYTAVQVAAWSPVQADMARWSKRMRELSPFVAIPQGAAKSDIVGYSDLQPDGLIDHLFVHRDWQGRGVATALMSEVERRANERGLRDLHAFVSITAQGLFARYGFVVERENTVDMDGIELRNFLMRRKL